MELTVTKTHKHLGALIEGVDLSKPLSAINKTKIKKAFLENSVIIFRNQVLSAKQQINLTKIFGTIDVHPLEQFHLEKYPEILVLSNKTDADGNPLGLEDAGQYWHTDVSFTPIPSLGSLLHAKQVPPEGGDTLFSSQYAAWENLSEKWKLRIESLRGLHGLNSITAPRWTKKQLAAVQPVSHPLVRTHPETGRKAIYAGIFVIGIDGMNRQATKEIIQYLSHHCSKSEFIYKHKWKKLDLVIWDNRCVLHHATEFPKKYSRHMHRTTVSGDKPF